MKKYLYRILKIVGIMLIEVPLIMIMFASISWAEKPIRIAITDLEGLEQLQREFGAFRDLLSKKTGTTLVMVNSVCGCAAGNARPAVIMATNFDKQVDTFATVFAGQDIGATAKAREFMLPFPPSSPSIAVFKEGKLVHFIERHHIEGRAAEMIADNLKNCFDQIC